MPLKLLKAKNGNNYLFLSSTARLRAISIFSFIVLANWASWVSTRLFLFGHLQDSRAKDLHLSLVSRDASLRGLQGNHQNVHWCRSQKGRGGIRGGYTTQCLTFLKGYYLFY